MRDLSVMSLTKIPGFVVNSGGAKPLRFSNWNQWFASQSGVVVSSCSIATFGFAP
jgi:hypothetical protein